MVKVCLRWLWVAALYLAGKIYMYQATVVCGQFMERGTHYLGK